MACRVLPTGEEVDDIEDPDRIIFLDDFSNPSSGWNRAETSSGLSDYADGVYRIMVREAFIDVWSMPGLSLEDVRIEVDAFKVGGERNNRFGIICRANGVNYYAFMVSSDGYYGIGKVRGLEHTLIGIQAMQPSEAINQGAALNHLRADCTGENLTLYVNDQLVQQARDGEFVSGDVGLIAGTYDTVGVEIFFDNFLVAEP
jgi:hypothetical protein